ncbi:MAG: hypothetical protein KAU29_11385, partial [Gammaproteobacteria bacterium]|nr:hypothetical protein [Gammaproteobacteria bacterium]
MSKSQKKRTVIKSGPAGDHGHTAKPNALNSFGTRIIQGLYNPITGMIIAILFILGFSYSQHVWPEHSETFFILQSLLSMTCLYLIIVVTQHVKTRIFAPLSQLHEWAQRMRSG